MASIGALLGNAKREDTIRFVNKESIPYRGEKKHGTQMSKKEKEFLFNRLKSVKQWTLATHALDRLHQKEIEATYDDIISVIHNSNIIEYHVAKWRGEKDNRVLLRAKSVVNKGYNLHVVYSLTRSRIVSVWINEVDDTHNTLDWRDYNKNMKILGV